MKSKQAFCLFSLLLLVCIDISSQSTRDLFSTNGYECLLVSVPSDPVDVPDGNVSLYYEGDTLMCGETLLKYSTAHRGSLYLKIEDFKVWVVDSCQHQRLLMDFGYNVGDTLSYEGVMTMVTDVGTTTLSDGKVRRTYRIRTQPNQFPDTHLFIEGIGSEYYGIEHTSPAEPNRTALACVNDQEGLEYENENINPFICELFTRTISDVEDNNFAELLVYPNPSQGLVHVSNPEGRSLSFSVFNLVGQELHSELLSSVDTEVDLSHLSRGQYFVILKDADLVAQTFKLILLE